MERRIPQARVRNWTELLAWSRQRPSRPNDFDPFTPAPCPPGVGPKGKAVKIKMAMDQATLGGYAQNWAPYTNLINQGYTFIGYPLLSELTQVPEYRVITEVIATEMTRKWIEFKSTGDEKSKQSKAKGKKIKRIEDRLKELRFQQICTQYVETDGYFGRAHMFLEVGDPDDRDELQTDIGNGRNDISQAKVSPKNPLKAIRVIEPIWTYPANYNSNDPLKNDWYNPVQWFVMAKQVHVSRLLKGVMREVPDLLKPAYSFGGLSLTQMAMPYVNNWLRTRQSVADIIHAFSVMVLATDLVQSLQADGNQLYERLEIFNNVRDNKGVMAIDKSTEEFTNIAAPLGTLDALQAQTQEHMAAVSRIPLVKLLGITPSGLNASSEGEIRVFEDTIASAQEAFLRPPITTVVDFIQLSEWGEVDPDIVFDFVPLHTMDELQLATKRKTEAETHQTYVDAGVISQEEVRQAVADDPDTPYHGLDVSKMPVNPAEMMPENALGEPINARHIVGQEEPGSGGESDEEAGTEEGGPGPQEEPDEDDDRRAEQPKRAKNAKRAKEAV